MWNSQRRQDLVFTHLLPLLKLFLLLVILGKYFSEMPTFQQNSLCNQSTCDIRMNSGDHETSGISNHIHNYYSRSIIRILTSADNLILPFRNCLLCYLSQFRPVKNGPDARTSILEKYRAVLNLRRYFNFQRTVLWKSWSKKRDGDAWTPFISLEMIDCRFIVCMLTIKSQFIIMNKKIWTEKSKERFQKISYLLLWKSVYWNGKQVRVMT